MLSIFLLQHVANRQRPSEFPSGRNHSSSLRDRGTNGTDLFNVQYLPGYSQFCGSCSPFALSRPLARRTTKHLTYPCYTSVLQSLPIEILLHIFSFLELKHYIISHAVSKDWQRLPPLTELHPIRRRMLELYHRIISTPNHEMTRPWTLENMQPFDRKTYINTLLAQYPVIPAEFQMWILEWPNCLAIRCTWPSLPVVWSGSENHQRRLGVNWLGYAPTCPHLSAVVYRSDTPDVKVIPALLIWREHVVTNWLIFDQDEPDLFGRVYVTDFMEMESSAVIPYPGQDPRRTNEPYPDWIAYMEYLWECTVSALELNLLHQLPDEPLVLPVVVGFDQTWDGSLPTFPWSLRNDVLRLAWDHQLPLSCLTNLTSKDS